jgi:hypothetical protein
LEMLDSLLFIVCASTLATFSSLGSLPVIIEQLLSFRLDGIYFS